MKNDRLCTWHVFPKIVRIRWKLWLQQTSPQFAPFTPLSKKLNESELQIALVQRNFVRKSTCLCLNRLAILLSWSKNKELYIECNVQLIQKIEKHLYCEFFSHVLGEKITTSLRKKEKNDSNNIFHGKPSLFEIRNFPNERAKKEGVTAWLGRASESLIANIFLNKEGSIGVEMEGGGRIYHIESPVRDADEKVKCCPPQQRSFLVWDQMVDWTCRAF